MKYLRENMSIVVTVLDVSQGKTGKKKRRKRKKKNTHKANQKINLHANHAQEICLL